ncbi:uncharacterized protein LOC143200612 [Rhynchophorus ferrugineus]|uniref:uncharacterized protein LOC143200612 n=1 Tax=Rhynchophorus ferrugineus TaxID=354439 RepID=UPI003FCCA36F
MRLHRVTRTLLEEASKLSESIHESPENFDHHRPPFSPPRSECSIWYIWASVIVVIAAIISVVVILVHFCRLNRERSSSFDHICANIELNQNVSTSPPPVNTATQNITVIEKY